MKKFLNSTAALVALLTVIPGAAQTFATPADAVAPSGPIRPSAGTVALPNTPAAAAPAPSSIEARLAGVEARLAVLESRQASAAPTVAARSPATVPPLPGAATPAPVKLAAGLIVGVHPIDKDLTPEEVEIGNFETTGLVWPAKMSGHESHGVHYAQPAAYIIDGYLNVLTAGKYLLGVQIERTGLQPGQCKASMTIEGHQIAAGDTGKMYAARFSQQPFQGLSQVDLEKGAYQVHYVIACNDQEFNYTLLERAPDDHGPRGLRPEEMQHKAADKVVSAKK